MADQPAPPANASENWRRNERLAKVWDRGVKSKPVAMVYGVLVFGTDNRKLYAEMRAVGDLPSGASVLDVPSGGGVLLRHLDPSRGLRYTAADISPEMLRKVAVEASRGGFEGVAAEEADAGALPFADGSFDAVVTFNGLHCVPDPRAALREMVRVLRPGGELRGCLVVRGAGAVQDRFIDLWRRMHILDVVVPADEFAGWLRDAGLRLDSTRRSGAVLYFHASRPAAESG
jgi:SAM-dependent methyltransferase